MRIRGEQSPTSHGLGCLGQVLYTRDQPRVAFAAHGGYSIPHTHNKIKPFLRKNPKRLDFVRKKPKKVQNLTQKPAKRGTTDYPLFPPIVSVRFAHLPASQKDGGNVEPNGSAGRTVAVPRNYRGAERATMEARARAAATQRLSKVISWQLTARAIQSPKRNDCPRLQNTIFVQLRQSGGGVHAVRVGCHQPPFVRATTQKYVSILYNCQESAASEAATPRPWCGA